ncbi:Reverse transcriptase zinc-binding domain [Macleaya cordata]|uniref:Reverse transcriptase zinc-binding domain n=1 Tax=Macleaya cordata TaxID=56857 RepID=A0A200QY46_MACCD|nr:Reverse transcriptase zinc-binding domain [Macleaya cordata]
MMHLGTPSLLIQSISNITGYQRKSTVMTYLGAPIYEGRAKIGYFDALLTKFRNKFAGWKANFLTQGGKLVMVRHVLSSMAIYLLSADVVPKKAICRPVLEGGLGVRYIEDVYGINNFSLLNYVAPCTASKFWKEYVNLIDVLVKNSAWKISNGDMNFWFENWSNEGILADTLVEAETYSSVTLKEAVEAEFCIPGLSESSASHVRNMYDSRLQAESDVRLWAPTTSGLFSVKSAFEQIRDLAPVCPFARFYWATFIPKKLSVFFWCSLHIAVPVDVRIQNCAISLASGCVCCTQSKIESFDHLFMHSDLATYIWDLFGHPLGLNREDFQDFRDMIWAWFNVV